MELLKDSLNTVRLAGNENWTVSATWALNGTVMPALPAPMYSNGTWNLALPYLPVEGEVAVTWSITIPASGTFPRTDYYDVVTPYLSLRQIMIDCELATEEEAAKVEASVRYVINAHTGQSFGLRTATYNVPGTGQSALALPARLVSVNKFNGMDNASDMFEIVGNGWYLTVPEFGVPPVRADYYGLHMHRGGVIHNPYGVKPNVFNESTVYTIEGDWGWKSVPAPVEEAARLLSNDLASGDSIYRDRYISQMTAADWRLQFTSGAFSRTGNARADQLLTEYVVPPGWVVI